VGNATEGDEADRPVADLSYLVDAGRRLDAGRRHGDGQGEVARAILQK